MKCPLKTANIKANGIACEIESIENPATNVCAGKASNISMKSVIPTLPPIQPYLTCLPYILKLCLNYCGYNIWRGS